MTFGAPKFQYDIIVGDFHSSSKNNVEKIEDMSRVKEFRETGIAKVPYGEDGILFINTKINSDIHQHLHDIDMLEEIPGDLLYSPVMLSNGIRITYNDLIEVKKKIASIYNSCNMQNFLRSGECKDADKFFEQVKLIENKTISWDEGRTQLMALGLPSVMIDEWIKGLILAKPSSAITKINNIVAADVKDVISAKANTNDEPRVIESYSDYMK